MPNHCENDLYISGPENQVTALLELIGANKEPPEFNFSAVIPYPEKFDRRDKDAKEMKREEFTKKYGDWKDGFNSGGYEWCIANWGTKWGAYQVARRDYESICITFQTAWSPAPKIIAELHKRFPDCRLSLEYFECGMGFSGGVSFVSKDWTDESEEWAAGVPYKQWINKEYGGMRGG